MISGKPARRLAGKRPRFLWRGLLIVLPALVMALFGFVSLRQDRLLVRHQAAEEAEQLAADLVRLKLPAALRLQLEFPRTPVVDDDLTPIDDPVLVASREGIVVCLLDDQGALRYPPAFRWPAPNPLVASELTDEFRPRWTTARREFFAGDHRAETAVKFEALLREGLPDRFAACARLHLLDLSLRQGQVDTALSHLRQIRREHATTTTESGLPARLLAEWCWLRRSNGAANDVPQADVNWLCSYAVLEPGPVSRALLDDANRFGAGPSQTSRGWDETWNAHQRSRELAGFLGDTPLAQLGEDQKTRSGWIEWGDRDVLLLVEVGSAGAWWQAWPQRTAVARIGRVLEASSVPPYLGCSVSLDGRKLTGETTTEPALAASTATLAGSGGAELTATIWLADPGLLYARQRTRTLWFGALIAVSAAAVLCGVVAAWRGFNEQQRMSEMKSNFVSSVSHEMRAPIAAVRLMAEELVDRGSADPVKAAEYHGYILQECRRLSGLIENVLDFSRHEQGRKQYRIEPTDLVAVVEETLHVMRSYAADRKVAIEQRVEGAPVELDVDAAAMQQVLVNLVDNAIKHSPEGASVEVTLAYPDLHQATNDDSRSIPNGAAAFQLSVRDEGPGIPPEEQRLIFQRFYRRGTELRRETQGIGLGLAIVQYVAEAHGGNVRVESHVGQGSRFIVDLPVTRGTTA
jgi:signal transduction histidine kinase